MGRGGNKALFYRICSLAPWMRETMQMELGSKALFYRICSLAPLAGRGKVRGRMSPMIWAIWYQAPGMARPSLELGLATATLTALTQVGFAKIR